MRREVTSGLLWATNKPTPQDGVRGL